MEIKNVLKLFCADCGVDAGLREVQFSVNRFAVVAVLLCSDCLESRKEKLDNNEKFE